MLSHIHPWANTIVLGGTDGVAGPAPCRTSVWGALGEASGTVSFHLHEQGRPQGASFSAGDLRSTLATNRQPNLIVAFPSLRVPAVECTGSDRIEEMQERIDTLEQFSDEYENLTQIFADSHPMTMDPEGRVILARAPQGTRRDRLRRRLCRARRDVSTVGPGALRGVSCRGPRTLAPAGHDLAAARRRGAASRRERGVTRAMRRRDRTRRSASRAEPARPDAGDQRRRSCPGAGRCGCRGAGAARRRGLCRWHVRRRRLQRGAARGGAMPRPRRSTATRPRCDAAPRLPCVSGRADADRRTVRRHGRGSSERLSRPDRRRRARSRRLVDAARQRRARVFVPARRAARHAHGRGRRERRRSRRAAFRRRAGTS